MGSAYGRARIRPALLEVVLLFTSAGAAVLAVVAGETTHCTVLVEFGILSTIAAASAGILFVRYALEIGGLFAGYRRLEMWGVSLTRFGYACLGIFALANALLDVFVPRRDTDAISYPGLICTVLAVLVMALVLQTKYRALQDLPRRSLLDSAAEDEFYLKVGTLTLVALVAHVFAPAWWLDTATDVILVVLVAFKLQGLIGRSSAAS